MDFEKVGGHNAAVRGYILRMLVKGYHMHTYSILRPVIPV